MSDLRRKYAPLWIMAFSGATAVAKVIGERMLLQKDKKTDWSDFATIALGMAVGYAFFRKRHGNTKTGWLTR